MKYNKSQNIHVLAIVFSYDHRYDQSNSAVSTKRKCTLVSKPSAEKTMGTSTRGKVGVHHTPIELVQTGPRLILKIQETATQEFQNEARPSLRLDELFYHSNTASMIFW